MRLPLSARFLAVAVGFLALNAHSPVGAKADPVFDFISYSDSLYQTGGEAGLSLAVFEHPLLVGAAVGTLLDIAVDLLPAQAADAKENADFAARLTREHAGRGPSQLLADYQKWTPTDLSVRAAAKALVAQADSARGDGDPEAAVSFLEAAGEKFKSIDDTRSLAILSGSLGVAHWYRGDWDAVKANYREALSRRRAIEDHILEGRTLNGLGSAHFNTSQLDSALHYYEAAAEIREATGDLGGLGTSLTYAGNVRLQMGQPARARALYERAAPVLAASAPLNRIIENLVGIANLYAGEGELLRAESEYLRALEMSLEEEGTPQAPQIRVNLGRLLMQRGSPSRALPELEAALAQLAEQPNPVVELHALGARGEVHLKLANRDGAREDFLAARALATELGDPGGMAGATIQLGWLYLAFDAPDQALQMGDLALTQVDSLGILPIMRDAHFLAGQAQEALRDLGAARVRLEMARELDRESESPLTEAESEMALANVLNLAGESSEARAAYRRALAGFLRGGREDNNHISLLGLGHSFESEDPDSAAHWYEAALRSIEEDRSAWASGGNLLALERGAAFEGVAWFYARQAQAQDSESWSEKAFAVSERAKAWSLRQQLGEEADHSTKLRELQKSLAKKELLLAFSVGDSATLLWAVDRKERSLHILPSRSELALPLQQLRDALTQPGAGDARLLELARSLGTSLLGSLGERLDRAEKLSIAADGLLHELPFELLLIDGETQTLSQSAWLGRTRTTHYLPAASLRAGASRSRSKGKGVLALGLSSFDALSPRAGDAPLVPLPFAIQEVETLCGKQRNCRVLLNGDATEAALRSALLEEVPRVLHLATHGLLDPQESANSAVALFPSGEDDGYWRADEIARLNLPCELVVLSACESGRGRIERGEGVLGLSRSFLAAGSRNVLGSLWSVNDESTSVLMALFHQELEKNDPATALQRARQKMMQKESWSHPLYWAPFVLVSAGG